MDFYTSPITVEVDGVDVRLDVLAATPPAPAPDTDASSPVDAVPDAVHLAQSFLETQPDSERKKLEDALALGAHDSDASAAASDDGSDDGAALGTGQPLSLPVFLAQFLQGVADRMQVTIKGVKFQLDIEVPVDVAASSPEPVSLQVAIQDVEIEGVTAGAQGEAAEPASSPPLLPKEGKRHIALTNVSALLISEANIFPSLTASPSFASPSRAPSPAAARNPVSRQATSLSQGSFQTQPMAALQESFREHMLHLHGQPEPAYPLGDSDEAPDGPHDPQGALLDGLGGESPPTPRASSIIHFGEALEESAIHSLLEATPESVYPTNNPEEDLLTFEDSVPALDQALSPRPLAPEAADTGVQDGPPSSAPPSSASSSADEDLAESRLFTHDEAESMYMSAFSTADARASVTASRLALAELSDGKREWKTASAVVQRPWAPMPGAWGDDSKVSQTSCHGHGAPSSDRLPGVAASDSTGEESLPAFSRTFEVESRPRPASEEAAHEAPRDQDDVATPKGPARVAREVLHLAGVSIHVPPQHQHILAQAPSPESAAQLPGSSEASLHQQPPGAFSLHGAARFPPASPPAPPTTHLDDQDNALEVFLAPMRINFDASVAFVLAMVVDSLLKAVGDGYADGSAPHESRQNVPPKKATAFKVVAEEISLSFVNALRGVAETSERYLDPSAFMFEQEVLLSATLQNLAVSVSQARDAIASPVAQGRSTHGNVDSVTTTIELEKFRLGYANGDIVSFDSSRPMSTSVRDAFLSSGHDIGMKIVQSGKLTRVDVETLPLVVQIDLQRLDETFSWFGGLSSFLNMSASMTSNPSPAPKSSSPVAPPKSRGVRFETSLDAKPRDDAALKKANVRMGGALVELVGRDCTVAAETSAVKFVIRDEGIGVACSLMRISGPYLRNSLSDPAVTAEVGAVRLEFLTVPKDKDLEKLLDLILPSKVRFDEGSDEIMVDTLLRQRRKGSVLRVNLDTVGVRVKNLGQLSPALSNLGEEISKLSTVAKYLPEDDRPGLLTLGMLQRIDVDVDVGDAIGHVEVQVRDLEVGHITLPSLVAVAMRGLSVRRNGAEELVSSPMFDSPETPPANGPVFMARMIGDEMEPTVKLKLHGLRVEYRVSAIMAMLGLGNDATPQDFDASLAASVVNLGDQAHATLVKQSAAPPAGGAKPMTLDVGLRDCLVGLNPLNLSSKMAVALTDAHLQTMLPKDGKTTVTININKASVLLIDDVSAPARGGNARVNSRRRSSSAASRQVAEMCARGFVDICYISSASVVAKMMPSPDGDGERHVEVELRDDLLVLETCADSTQTLITLANALKPPTPPSKESRFRTKVMPVQDLLASISAEAFGRPEGEYDFDQDFAGAQEMAGSGSDVYYGRDSPLRVQSDFFGEHGEELFDATKSHDASPSITMQGTPEGILVKGLDDAQTAASGHDGDSLVIHDDFYGGDECEDRYTAKVWNSSRNTYDRAPEAVVRRSPLKVLVRDVHIIWNLFDGYDWAHTRDVIAKAVEDVEAKAVERQSRPAQVYEEELEDEETIGDFLFNSIYIGVPASRDPQDLTRAINEGLDDTTTETESVATTALTAATGRTARRHQAKPRRLRLKRSKHHKITFELQGVNVDVVTFAAGAGETLSSIDVRVQALDIFDHVPTSTWKKFATYDQDQGEREMGASMVHVELLTVKPLPDLAASELVLRVTVLPLRLHVDQDALDFITRFFEFKDENVPVHASAGDVPFLQRVEINQIPVKLDFKPKRVDYGGLRSGHTTEFMNFIVLEESRMVLRRAIVYGISGFDRMGKTLNDIWMPDVRNNQLPGVVAGLAPVRSLVNIGSGFRDLVEIPLREYQKDGRVMRSISKGAAAFVRTTGTELVKFGAKLAVGTQYALQGAEDMLTADKESEASAAAAAAAEGGWYDDDSDGEEKKQISLYADQPTGVLQGLRGGYRSLARDVSLARDAIIAVPGEVMQSQSAAGAAKAVWKRAPTIVFRPAVGVSKAIGQTLMGATNTIDPHNRRRIGEVSERAASRRAQR